ncbi:MAG: hypothetical protein AAGJ70_06865 [Pseudomonadota bacterium]
MLTRRNALLGLGTTGLATALASTGLPASARAEAAKPGKGTPVFRRVRTEYIAVLGDPKAKSGTGAETWAWWYKDPGPRGVHLLQYDDLVAAGGRARYGWTFDKTDWWLDENGIIMERPTFDVVPGRYVVTGDREAVAIMTIHPADDTGTMRWELSHDVTLHDVTHMPCRSARYTPVSEVSSCDPKNADLKDWPVKPGGIMPDIPGCNRQDYHVLFVIGREVKKPA